ncbi:MAG: ATP-binding protein [Desulfovibrionaceae bacterium]
MDYIKRNITTLLEESILTRPLTYLNGARQVGKTTLCANFSKKIKMNHITFDTPLLLSTAKSDPGTFIDNLPTDALNVIDEVQFAPEIFPYLKIKIDENRLNGNNKPLYLVTGSANLMALPTLSEALVGRMSIITLYPFATNEYKQVNVDIIEKLFNEPLTIKKYPNYDIIESITHATYPELITTPNLDKNKWFDNYLTTIFNRDIRTLSDIRNPDKMIMLLAVLSMRTGGLLNNTAIASEIGLDYKTYEKFITFALNSFLVFSLKAWAMPNKLNKRFTKSPKLYFTDCNLLSYIMKRSIEEIYHNDTIAFGHIFENFVATELLKHSKNKMIELSHFRTQAGKEVDFVLENTTGDIVAIEVKSSKSVTVKDCSGLLELKNIAEHKFKRGIILYNGNDIVPLTEQIWAIPICWFWS